MHRSEAVPFIGKDCPSTASEFAHPDVAIGSARDVEDFVAESMQDMANK